MSKNEPIVLIKTTQKQSKGCALVLTAVAGSILLVCALGVSGVLSAKGVQWEFLIGLPFVLILLWIARWVFVAPHLNQIVLDMESKTLTEIFVTATGKQHNILRNRDDFEKIVLYKTIHSSTSGGSSTSYHVSVASAGIKDVPVYVKPLDRDKKFIELDSFSSDYGAARQFAEQVARYLDMPLEDISEGNLGIVRKPDELDKSLRQRSRTDGIPDMPEEIPEDLVSAFSRKNGDIVIDFPPYKMKMGCLIPIGFIGIWVAVSGMTFFESIFSSHQVSYLAGGSMILPLSMTLLGTVFIFGRRQRIIIGKDLVIHEMFRILPRKVVTMEKDAIEDIAVSKSTLINPPAILIRGDKGQIELGNMEISDRERTFICDFLRTSLSI